MTMFRPRSGAEIKRRDAWLHEMRQGCDHEPDVCHEWVLATIEKLVAEERKACVMAAVRARSAERRDAKRTRAPRAAATHEENA